MELGYAIVEEEVRKEREIWKKALHSVRCILPDDAEDVIEMAKRIRKERHDT